jgi:hypothetical protein
MVATLITTWLLLQAAYELDRDTERRCSRVGNGAVVPLRERIVEGSAVAEIPTANRPRSGSSPLVSSVSTGAGDHPLSATPRPDVSATVSSTRAVRGVVVFLEQCISPNRSIPFGRGIAEHHDQRQRRSGRRRAGKIPSEICINSQAATA